MCLLALYSSNISPKSSNPSRGMSQKAGTGFYYGSRLLQPASDVTGLSIDQVNFVATQLAAILLAVPFHWMLHPSRVSATTRHLFEFIFGVILVFFCFGSQFIHLCLQTLLCYVVMHTLPRYSHGLCFFVSMGYLSVLQIYRQIYDYGGYTLDITGPLMISTQKLSDLAFSVHDGMQKEEKQLNPSQLKYAQKKIPSILEMMSYVFAFHFVMVGPTAFYQDYSDFISGRNIGIGQSSFVMISLKKLLTCLICVVLVTQVTPLFPVTYVKDEEYLSATFLYKVAYMLLSVSLVRAKYYFAWSLAEMGCVANGYGYNGLKEDGTEDWDMIQNADVWGVETCTSMKLNMDSWNIRTLMWLRRTVYDRVPRHNTLAVFFISAFWHGFYPGFYIAFSTGAAFIFANRSIRRVVRPYFLKSRPLHFFYDVITFIGTRLCNVYMAVPVILYEFMPVLNFYRSQYFWMHIIAFAAIFCLPKRPSSRKKTE
ncbi:lysophospholipid acyltransferase 6-like isoform X2 [Watersipora subatra]|uniref:lysophospholipid acyltransferase 6-like isoform X2 n=1 Tax=Watersipora subatra TaxID=2589382 RepID=UPI00355B16CD